MERFAKTMTGTVLALGLVLGAATSASAFNPQPEPPVVAGVHRARNPYVKPNKPAEFHKMRKVPQVRTRLSKPQVSKRRILKNGIPGVGPHDQGKKDIIVVGTKPTN